MSQTPYNAISQGPAIIPMDHYGGQQRITPPLENFCTPRRTKIIIAIIILSILWIASIVVWVFAKIMVVGGLEEASRSYSYSSSSNY